MLCVLMHSFAHEHARTQWTRQNRHVGSARTAQRSVPTCWGGPRNQMVQGRPLPSIAWRCAERAGEGRGGGANRGGNDGCILKCRS